MAEHVVRARRRDRRREGRVRRAGRRAAGIPAATSADGKYVCTAIIRIEAATGACETIHEEELFITHVNHSPTVPNALTFCHEGQREHVEQRIRGLDIGTGTRWKIRDQSDRRYTVGHEYWFADGERIGCHGRRRSGAEDEHVYGFARWDGSDATGYAQLYLVEIDDIEEPPGVEDVRRSSA